MEAEILKKYFWEVKTKKLDLIKRKIYILKRLLEYGDPVTINWAWRFFSKKDWLKALKSREVSSSTRKFWLSLLSLKK